MTQTRMCLSTRLFNFHHFANFLNLSIKEIFVPKATYGIRNCLHVCLLQKKMSADALKTNYFDILKNSHRIVYHISPSQIILMKYPFNIFKKKITHFVPSLAFLAS